jgi:hypothetical protein
MSSEEIANSSCGSQSLDPTVAFTSVPTLDVASLMVTTDGADSMLNLQSSHEKDTGFLSSDHNPGTFNHGEHIIAPSDLAKVWDGCIDDDLFRDDAMGNLGLDNDMFLVPPLSETASIPVDQATDETPTCNDDLHQYLKACVPSNTLGIAQSVDNPMRSLDGLRSTPSTIRSTSLPFMAPTDGQPGLHRDQADFMLLTPTSHTSQDKQAVREIDSSVRRSASSMYTSGSWSQFLHNITSPSRDSCKPTDSVDKLHSGSVRHTGFDDYCIPQPQRSKPCKCSRSQQTSVQSSIHSTGTPRDPNRGSSLPNMPEEGMSSMQLLELSARFARLADAQRQRGRQVLSRRTKVRASEWSRPYNHHSPRVDWSSCEDDELLDYLADEASSLENQDDLLIQFINCRRQRSQ